MENLEELKHDIEMIIHGARTVAVDINPDDTYYVERIIERIGKIHCENCGMSLDKQTDQKVKRTIPKGYQRCPVCNGVGRVSGGFYDRAGDQELWQSTGTIELCRTCKGTGTVPIIILWLGDKKDGQ